MHLQHMLFHIILAANEMDIDGNEGPLTGSTIEQDTGINPADSICKVLL